MTKTISVTVEVPNWVATATFKRVFVPKQVGDSRESIPIKVRNVVVHCKRSGGEFKFPLTVRGGVASFGDSRETADLLKPRLTPKDMRALLAAWLGADNADKLMNVVLG